jgi:hypothetical protein
MAVLDFFGEELKTMDYIISTIRHEENQLAPFQIIGISPKGFLKLKGTSNRWLRTQLQDTRHCIKITEEQYNKLVKKV